MTTKKKRPESPESDRATSKHIDLPDTAAEPTEQEQLYRASPVKRRATRAEMEERAEFLIDYAAAHAPVTVRQLYYRAEVEGVSGIDKEETSYRKIQEQVLNLRRAGAMPYRHIADATRWMRKPASYDSVEDALESTAQHYKRSLWTDNDSYVEVWCEKDALAGVIYPVTSDYDVPLMVTRGFTSETFAYEAIAAREYDKRAFQVYTLFDFDRSGRDAQKSLTEKLIRFADEAGVNVNVDALLLDEEDVDWLKLPTRAPKRNTQADRNWPYDFACELDAVEPDTLREIVEGVILLHIDKKQLKVLRAAEKSERELLKAFARKAA